MMNICEIYVFESVFCMAFVPFCIKGMSELIKKIKADWNFVAEFSFHRVYTTSGKQRYHISVKDVSGSSLFFNMDQKEDGSWKIVDAPKVPEWIMELEPQLQHAILQSKAA
jgi:hypothetical protein